MAVGAAWLGNTLSRWGSVSASNFIGPVGIVFRKLTFEPVSIFDVEALRLDEPFEDRTRVRCVMPVDVKFGDQTTLSLDERGTFGDMPFRLL